MNRLLVVFFVVLLAVIGFLPLAYADTAPDDLPQGLVFRDIIYDNPASYRLNAGNPVTDISTHYYLNGQVYQIKPLFRKDNRIFIPLRVAGEAFGRVDWDNAKKQATITDGSNTVLVTLNSTTISVNGQTRQMDVAPILIDDTVYLPFRAIGEALNKYVDYYERNTSDYYIVMTETKEDCQSIESDQQFVKVFSSLTAGPNSTLLAYSRNYTIFKNNETNEYMLDGFISLSEVMGGRWLVDDLHIEGLEGDTTKYWVYFPRRTSYEEKYVALLAAFYPDGSVRIISDSLDDDINFLLAKDGYLYCTSALVENNEYYFKRINLKTPKGQTFEIENLGEKGYLYGPALYQDSAGNLQFSVYNSNDFDFREDGIYTYGLTLSDFNKAQKEKYPSIDLYPSYAMYKIFYDGNGQEKVGEGKIITINNTNTQ